ncbi:hypothetical protein [Leptospira interrogans]|nr:hypothetical protein [Leptospira interrogans]
MDSPNRQFELSLPKSNLLRVGEGITESLIDSILGSGFIKDIPILGTLSGLIKSALNIRDYLFARKVIRFMIQLKDISEDDITGFIQAISENPKEKRKVGISLLPILEKVDEEQKADLIGFLFVKMLKGKIEYELYLRFSTAIANIFWSDFLKFRNLDENDHNGNSDFFPLILFGLAKIYDLGAIATLDPFPTSIRLTDDGVKLILFVKEYFNISEPE